MSTATSANFRQIRIQLVEPSGTRREFRLVDGGTLMVGSGANCGVRLSDPTISAIHCLIRLRDGEIELQDWCTQLGTFINGERIEEEATLQLGSELRIGKYVLTMCDDAGAVGDATAAKSTVNSCCGSGHRQPIEAVTPPPAKLKSGFSLDVAVANVDLKTPASNPQAATHPSPEPQQTGRIAEPLPNSPTAEANAPPTTLTSTLASTSATTSTSTSASTSTSTSASASASAPSAFAPATPVAVLQRPNRPVAHEEAYDAEALQLLRAEIECLQTELAERDRQLAEFALLVDGDLPAIESTDSAEVEKLVARLESLLAELERNDQRTHALEELLRAEQELVRHQEEEQQQMESWLGEIEQRITAREGEWNAEREVLNTRIEQLRKERDEADRCLQHSGGNGVDPQQQESIVTALRSEMDQLKDELERQRQATQAAVTEVNELKVRSPEQFAREQIEEAIRTERLALAQERAALSRERAELARGTASTESIGHERPRTNADDRFIAFRQTLKEIHKEELKQETQPRKQTLGARIADLWRRLDGPTDTD